MNAVLQRLRQPSTWSGLAALAILAGQVEAAQAIQVLGTSVPDAAAAISALVAIVANERGAVK